MSYIGMDQIETERDQLGAESEDLTLGQLDITTDSISLSGLEKDLDAFGDSSFLAAVLDRGRSSPFFLCLCLLMSPLLKTDCSIPTHSSVLQCSYSLQ